jgi:tetratricopeptide (TPR) repeat protein
MHYVFIPVFIVPSWIVRFALMSRPIAPALAIIAVAAALVPAAAQPSDPSEQLKPVEPPSSLPRAQRGDRAQNLDRLFEALKLATDDESAKFIENRIWAIWMASASDTTNLLMGRVKTAVDGQDLDLAVKLLNAIIDIKPDFTEAWNRRATVYYAKKEFGRALADIRQVLAREPRHFGALSGLGIILQEMGDEKHALDAFRRALALHPHLERIPDLVKKLTDKIDGRDI